MSLAGRVFKYISSKADQKRDANLTVDETIMAHCDVPYGNGKKYNLLDVYYPKGTKGKLPVIVNIHGGGYVYGTKKNYLHYGMSMAKQGFVFVNFNYHLAPRKKFPHQLGEINLVMKWILEHADAYHIDIQNIFLTSDSVGAQMASQYCTIRTNETFAKRFSFTIPAEIEIRAVALNCGIYDISLKAKQRNETGMNMEALIMDYLGTDRENIDSMLQVTENITSDFPPAFVMTAEYDIFKEEAWSMYESLRKRGVPVIYQQYGEPGQTHMRHIFHCDLNLEEAKVCNTEQANFFKDHMRMVEE